MRWRCWSDPRSCAALRLSSLPCLGTGPMQHTPALRKSKKHSGESCGSSVVEHSLGKGEAESSILSRSTSKTQGNSTLSDFPWENIALRKYGTLRENTGQNAGKLGKTRAVFLYLFSSCSNGATLTERRENASDVTSHRNFLSASIHLVRRADSNELPPRIATRGSFFSLRP